MADALPQTAIAVPWTNPGGIGITVTDSAAGSPHSYGFAGLTYRHFLAYATGTPTGTAGTEADPHEAGAYLQYLLNNSGTNGMWTVGFTTAGKYTIRYNGTGTGQIAWSGTRLLPFYGFTGNLALSAGSTATATYGPSHFAVCHARANDTGLTVTPQKFAGAEMPDGTVYGWGDGRVRSSRAFDLRFAPKDAATAATLGAYATPMFAANLNQAQQPTRNIPVAYVQPWSLWETLTASPGVRIAYTDQFQAMVAGSVLTFYEGYLALETLNAAGAVRPSAPYWDGRYDWTGVKVWHFLNANSGTGYGTR